MAAILYRPHCVNLIIDAYTDSLNIIWDTKQPIQYSCKIKAASLRLFHSLVGPPTLSLPVRKDKTWSTLTCNSQRFVEFPVTLESMRYTMSLTEASKHISSGDYFPFSTVCQSWNLPSQSHYLKKLLPRFMIYLFTNRRLIQKDFDIFICWEYAFDFILEYDTMLRHLTKLEW